jgi:type I restriction enzyme M protein
MGYMKTRVHRDFSTDEMDLIEQTYQNWEQNKNYKDIKGFCKSANITDMQKHNFVLTPGRYVGMADEEDDGIPFEDKMNNLTSLLSQQITQEKILDDDIKVQLAKIGFQI